MGYTVEFKNVGRTDFSDVLDKGLDFTEEFDAYPSEEELKAKVFERYAGADIHARNGRVSFCNGNKGCYVVYGTYTIREV